MDYHLFKPLILRAIAESDKGELSVASLVKSVGTQTSGERNLSTLRSKVGWAVRELKAEGLVLRKPEGFLRLSKRAEKQSNRKHPHPPLALTGRLFEEECRRILSHLKFSKIKITGKTCDRGVDGEATYSIGGEIDLKFAFQSKGGGKKVSSPQVREFIGSITSSFAAGIIFSSAGFTEEALAVARKITQPSVYLLGKEAISRYYKNKHMFP